MFFFLFLVETGQREEGGGESYVYGLGFNSVFGLGLVDQTQPN